MSRKMTRRIDRGLAKIDLRWWLTHVVAPLAVGVITGLVVFAVTYAVIRHFSSSPPARLRVGLRPAFLVPGDDQGVVAEQTNGWLVTDGLSTAKGIWMRIIAHEGSSFVREENFQPSQQIKVFFGNPFYGHSKELDWYGIEKGVILPREVRPGQKVDFQIVVTVRRGQTGEIHQGAQQIPKKNFLRALEVSGSNTNFVRVDIDDQK